MMYLNTYTIYTLLSALNFDLKTIATYYGIICLFCLPISLAAIIFIYRKRPDIVKSMDAAVDKLFGDKPEQKAKPAKPENSPEPKNESENEKAQPEPSKDAKEEIEEYGIPTLILFVGDRYKCVMSNKNRKDIGGTDFRWAVEDGFVGEILEPGGIFDAKHVGETYIKSLIADVSIYHAEVKPIHKDWFAATVMMDILKAEDINNIKVRNIKETISNLETERRILEYQIDGYSLSYEYSRDDAVRRALYILPDKEETRKGISEKIAEYMEPVKLTDESIKDVSYWYHETIEGKDEYVDFIAFMKRSSTGKLYFGIGESWRYDATVDEIIGNHLMIIRSFKELIDPADYPASVGSQLKTEPTKEQAAGREEIEKANNAGKDTDVDNQDNIKAEQPSEDPANQSEDDASNEKPDGSSVQNEIPDPEPHEEESEDSDETGTGDMEDESMDGGPDYGLMDGTADLLEEENQKYTIGHSDE